MAECKTCRKTFHACMSCGLLPWEWDFCTQKCLSEYIKNNILAMQIYNFYLSLDADTRKRFHNLLQEEDKVLDIEELFRQVYFQLLDDIKKGLTVDPNP